MATRYMGENQHLLNNCLCAKHSVRKLKENSHLSFRRESKSTLINGWRNDGSYWLYNLFNIKDVLMDPNLIRFPLNFVTVPNKMHSVGSRCPLEVKIYWQQIEEI